MKWSNALFWWGDQGGISGDSEEAQKSLLYEHNEFNKEIRGYFINT